MSLRFFATAMTGARTEYKTSEVPSLALTLMLFSIRIFSLLYLFLIFSPHFTEFIKHHWNPVPICRWITGVSLSVSFANRLSNAYHTRQQ
jgi:hypothetical protein